MNHAIRIDSAGGEYMESVLVLEWTRAPGEWIEAGETIAVVETAKAATEVPASHSGVLVDILVSVGQEAAVGAPLGHIGERAAATAMPENVEQAATGVSSAMPEPRGEREAGTLEARVVASPLARRVAREIGVDLTALRGTGPRGRIKERDVRAAANEPSASRAEPAPVEVVPGPRPQPDGAPDTGAAARSRSSSALAVHRDETPIVFIHGFGADRSAWRRVTPLLSPRRRMVHLELPGHGEAAHDRVKTIEDIAAILSDRLQDMGIDEAHLVGHSLGGAAALSLTEVGPLAVRSLVLIAPGGLGPEIDAGFLSGFVEASRPESLEPWLARMVANPSCLVPGFADALLRQRLKHGTQAAQRDLVQALFADGVQTMVLRPAFESLTMPAKVIWGMQDAIIPHSHAFGAPGSVALHLLPGVGHVPAIECPALVGRLIDELVRAQS